jgi:hypothetical protein
MAMKYSSQSCSVTSTWEWVITGYTPVTETEVTETKTVTITRTWHRYANEWQAGSLSWPSSVDGMSLVSISHVDTEPWTPSHWAAEGSTYTTSGTGVATYKGKKKSGGEPIYGWGHYSTSHNHPSSISYDDGTYAGTLTYDSCSGSASSPSSSGSYAGQQTSTTGSGTAYYSGDIPAKETPPSLSVAAKNINDTSVRATIENLMYAANYYHLFEVELWRGSEEEYLLTKQWTDSSGLNKYTSIDFSGLDPGTVYTIKGFVKSTSSSSRVHAGTVVFTTTGQTLVRPQNWSWTTLQSSGSVYQYVNESVLRANVVSADEWTNFCKRINDFRKYKKLNTINFTPIGIGTSLTSAIFNAVRNAIAEMTTVTNTVSTGQTGVKAKLEALKDSLNSIQ